MPNKTKKDTDLVLSIGGEEILRVKRHVDQKSKAGNPLPYTTRGFARVDSEAVGALRISINVIE